MKNVHRKVKYSLDNWISDSIWNAPLLTIQDSVNIYVYFKVRKSVYYSIRESVMDSVRNSLKDDTK